MENGNNEVKKSIPGKKELKKQLADKMETALPELRAMLGKKKFVHRLKKAAKLLMEGLHKEDVPKKKKEPVAKTAAKKGGKKAAAKKMALPKSATKKAAGKKAAAKPKAGKQ